MSARRLAAVALGLSLIAGPAFADPERWSRAWPDTDFSKTAVDFAEIFSGGPPRDGIPSIDDPKFVPIAELDHPDREPVVSVEIDGDARAYPLRILIWHEIVNDTVGGIPVAVTYCPLCNAAIVFDRRIDGAAVEFGTTGKLRNSDLVMYDRKTDSWWQQFTGTAIVGSLLGTSLAPIPARLESLAAFKARHPDGTGLVPNDPLFRDYGRNPYVGYDGADRPFLYAGELPEGIPPMAYVVAVEGKAWTLAHLRENGPIRDGDLVLSWTEGKASALDTGHIPRGRDIGNVVAQRNGADVVYDLTFAFVFHAFRPDGEIVGLSAATAAPGKGDDET